MDSFTQMPPKNPLVGGRATEHPQLPAVQRPLGRQALWRRCLFFGLTIATALGADFFMLNLLTTVGLSALGIAVLVLSTVLFAWIAMSFWTVVAGFITRLVGRDPAILTAAASTGQTLSGRTAIVIPVYNEETARVFAGIASIWNSLMRQRQQRLFDFFVLSDTRQAAVAEAEEKTWRAQVEQLNARGRLFYRRRADNIGRKSGNIGEFVRNWGGAYEYMIVLDADSIMSGTALVSLAQVMEANPDVGIIQTVTLLAGRETLFARLLQFVVRLNGPMYSSGLAYWQLGESNYWGHNAILRLRAFATHCSLPRLSGSPPFGGEILSHDIVESAFMRRAGYRIWLVPDIPGSWEEVPSNMIDFVARDRRWAQGNLQHFRVIPMRGLHWLSRLHMLTGILSYATAPIWLLALVLSSILICSTALHSHVYFQPGSYSLFPMWPKDRHGDVAALVAMTATLLVLPKLLGAWLALRDRAQRVCFGGGFRLSVSVLFEQLMSMLLAPTMMLFHTSIVLNTLLGRKVGWDAQPRGDRGVSWAEALRRHIWHLALGAAWTIVIVLIAPPFIWWMLPVLAGMLLSVPFTVLTSRASIGRRLRAAGMLLTPEETACPPELLALREAGSPASVAETPITLTVPQATPLTLGS
ncbi:MAG TPA: glucans biosynthesis glucosyltransferase MdoH [Steroidobacteraceae bacterium]|nr:glucans biosynthesis glucosyltransferase MdoH [Steroidobacteraceae bacterium]